MKTLTRIAAGSGLAAALAIGSVAGASAALADHRGQRPGGPGSSSQGAERGQFGYERGHERGGPLKDLVASSTITQAQADAVKDGLKAAKEAGRTDRQAEHEAAEKAALDALVKDGMLTQAQADAIASADRRGVRELVANGTITREQAQRIATAMRASHDARHEAKAAEHKAERDAVLAGLVKAGTITQAQSDAISTALDQAPGTHGKGHGKGWRR